MNILDFVKHFEIKKISKNSYQALCPAHNDKQASLTISYDNKNEVILLHCHAGCNTTDILNSVNLSLKELYNNNTKDNKLKEIARYIYTEENGVKKHATIRYIDSKGNKTFKQGYYDKNGNFHFGIKGQKIYLYRLPELIEDIAQDREIFFVEEEKDVDNLRKLGIPATTSPMGAGKWRDEFNKYFENAKIVIIPDNDEPGQKHAELIISNLINVAFSIKLIKLDVKEKGDVSDWLEARHTITELYTIVSNTPTYSKSKEIEQKIRIENDERIFQNEIENIRNYIYSEDDKPKILHDNVI